MGKNYIADNYVLALRYFGKKKKNTHIAASKGLLLYSAS